MSGSPENSSLAKEPYSRFARRILELQGAKNESDFVLFCSHQKKNGFKAVFSNWYVPREPIVDEFGREFRTSEHYMMVGKAELFGDKKAADAIFAASTAGKAKHIGRTIQNFNDDIWDAHAQRIVEDGCMLKFSQCSICKSALLGTGNKILVEASAMDCRWGIGMSHSDPRCLDPRQWRGENWLGEVLMVVRERLRKSEEPGK